MNEDPYEVFKMILQEKIRFPKQFNEGAKSIIRHLTEHDLTKRYGNLKNGSADIRKHRFFADVDFKGIFDMTATPPYDPSAYVIEKKKNLKQQFKYTS